MKSTKIHKPQHTLQMLADHYGPIPHHINHFEHHTGILQLRSAYPIHSTNDHRNQDQLPEFRTGYNKTISRKFLDKENSKLTHFFHVSNEIRHHWESNSQPLAPYFVLVATRSNQHKVQLTMIILEPMVCYFVSH